MAPTQHRAFLHCRLDIWLLRPALLPSSACQLSDSPGLTTSCLLRPDSTHVLHTYAYVISGALYPPLYTGFFGLELPRDNPRADNDNTFSGLMVVLLVCLAPYVASSSVRRYLSRPLLRIFFLFHFVRDSALSRMPLQSWSMYTLQASQGTLSSFSLHFLLILVPL